MRSHPVAGTMFILVGLGLFAAGAFASGTPGPLKALPLPPEIVVPFVLWQLATWSVLFGVFFLRPRSQRLGRPPRPVRL